MINDPARPTSFSAKRRAVRFRQFLMRFPLLPRMGVIDFGGTPDYWLNVPTKPGHVTTVNLDDFDPREEWITHVVGDACDLATLDRVGEHDVAVSNSLLEHVGGYQRRLELAAVIRAAAPAHWVQTPYRHFPIEPHYIAPMLQYFPLHLRAHVVRSWPLNHEPVSSVEEALRQVLTIELVTATELRHLFPDSTIWHERWCGLSKSIVAVRDRDM